MTDRKLLQVRNMSKSAAGSTETPGKQVRAKAGVNRSILDQGWCEFRRQLQYKLSWNGGELILVPPQNTSRRCPECGHVAAENRRTRERFACIACGSNAPLSAVGIPRLQAWEDVNNPALAPWANAQRP